MNRAASEPGDPQAADHLDDLRAQLPPELRDAPDREIAQLWVAWDAARRGHPIMYLTDTLALPDQLAQRLVELVGSPPNPNPSQD